MSLIKKEPGTASPRAEAPDVHQKFVERAIRRMKESLAEPVGLDQVAEAAGMSEAEFARVFDQITGTPPQHFLECLRIQRAKELLLTTDSSVTEICKEVGGASTSLSSFSRTFSALVGYTPQDFRAMPKKLDAMQFAKAVWGFLAARRSVKGPKLEGVVEGPAKPRGFTFVGTFTQGVPQGIPYSGTVLLTHGTFRIKRPVIPEFYLMAVLVPFTADLTSIVATIPVGLVASLRVQSADLDAGTKPRLRLRPMRLTDPPIVLALPALPLRPE
jgi:AraC family transcriptional regulator